MFYIYICNKHIYSRILIYLRMKKILLTSLISCVWFTNVNAQINITTLDMPTSEKIVYHGNDTMPTISVGSPSASSQNWDMSTLAQHTVDTSKVLNYSDHPNTLFSSANTLINQVTGNFYGYLLNSSSSFVLLGGSGVFDIQGYQTPVNQTNTPAEILFNFPTTYNSNFTNDYFTDAKFYYGQQVSGITIDSIHQRSLVKKTVLVDAWGTLTTPLGGPYNVLRIKEVKKTQDTVMAYFFGDWNNIPGGTDSTESTSYYWWANTIGTALVTATVDTNGTATNIQWLKSLPTAIPMSVNEIASQNYEISVYPNPVNNQLTILFDNASKSVSLKEPIMIDIQNELGQSVKKIELTQLIGVNKAVVDVADLNKGIYFIHVKNNSVNSTRKFIKQ